MKRINENPNCLKALGVQDFCTDLMDMSKKLDEIQKILFQLLELKRKDFPRFYFISNDDLFELLGNSKEPVKVNKHIKKCFEGIKKLEINTTAQAKGKLDLNEIVGMSSPDQETVKFHPGVQCENGIENWLKNVEKTMRDTLRKIL